MSFIEYQSKPVTRLAHQIQHTDTIEPVDGTTMAIVVDGLRVEFKHHEPPMNGDYIVYLNDSDVYHCSQEVFEERNVV